MARTRNPSHKISTLNERALHAALKEWYARPGDQCEVYVDGFLVDIARDDRLVEIQTRNFAQIKRKLAALAERHRVRLVYPIAEEKWIVRESRDGRKRLSRRKSPKRGVVEHVFRELVSAPALLAMPHFSLEVLLIREEEVRRQGIARAWRRGGWATCERRLLEVVDRRVFETRHDLAALVPDGLAEPFTTADLASAIGQPRPVAQQMAYCLREMGALRVTGKRRNALLYVRADD